MKLSHLILILLLFLASCAPIIKPHGYQLGDILLQEPQTIGKSTKEDVLTSYIFNPTLDSEFIFELKLKLFDMDFIKSNTNRELKKNLRISKTVGQAITAAVAIWESKEE